MFVTKSKLKVSLAVWRNLLPCIFQGGLQPGSPSRQAAPADQHKFYHPSSDVDELFLLGDSGQADPNRVMIFGRDNHPNWVQGEASEIA